jgi:hypothetical protein
VSNAEVTTGEGGQSNTVTPHDKIINMTARQIVLIVKIQSAFRGYLGRKKVQIIRQERGFQPVMGGLGGKFDKNAPTDYNNQNVKIKRKELGDFKYMTSKEEDDN